MNPTHPLAQKRFQTLSPDPLWYTKLLERMRHEDKESFFLLVADRVGTHLSQSAWKGHPFIQAELVCGQPNAVRTKNQYHVRGRRDRLA